MYGKVSDAHLTVVKEQVRLELDPVRMERGLTLVVGVREGLVGATLWYVYLSVYLSFGNGG